MTAALYVPKPPNAVDFVISWLRPIGDPCEAVKLQTDAVYPFRMVNRPPGTADERMELIADDALISVHTFASTWSAASDAADITHERMLVLVNDPTVTVTLFDGTPANAQYVTTAQLPAHVDYEEPDVWRFVSRYKLGLAFV